MKMKLRMPFSAALPALALLGAAVSVSATSLPDGFADSLVAGGLNNPTAMAFAPDGRLFVSEQTGALRVISAGGTLRTTPFVTLTVDSAGERGLLGVTFDPNFATNHYVYVYYTATTPTTHNRVSRFTANGDVAVVDSELALVNLPTLGPTNHNGGALHFDKDGKLYVAVGDNANGANAQSMATPLGKMLRYNSNGTVPPDNPFPKNTTDETRAVWAYGLRNPFTFDIQPGSGRIFINDVGQSAWEEINDGIAGSNYGWPVVEGFGTDSTYRNPLYAYDHTGACAIAGGAFYNPPVTVFPNAYVGRYFFADLCGQWIRLLDPASGNSVTTFATGLPGSPVDLRTGPDGALYYLTHSAAGQVRRISYVPGASPFGSFDTPGNGASGVQGAIALTGWALDDAGVSRLELWRDFVDGDPAPNANGKIFIGNATFVSGARSDVQTFYPAYPNADRAGWGYMLLTNLLPNANTGASAGGVGTFTLYGYIFDTQNNVTLLPTRTFTCDNVNGANKPFGTIDTPTQGQTVSGTISNFGWVLTPQPGAMATDGSGIVVYIDNIPRGTVQYNLPRSDIQALFPGYANSGGAIGFFSINTTTLANGLHTIAWSAKDNLNRADGIGSRYFTVSN